MEATVSRALRRKPLTDCSNVDRKSDKRGSGAVGFPIKEVSPSAADLKVDRRRKSRVVVDENVGVGCGKENVGVKEITESAALLSTPPVSKLKTASASFSVSPMTTYSRRKANTNSYGSSSCPPAGKKRGESSDEDDQSMSGWHTEPSKKKRSLPKDLIAQDFIERQRAYFQEIDKFELPEEEVSETE